MQQGVLILKLAIKPTMRDVEKLRGYIAGQFNEEVLFHNHEGDYDFRYKLPLVQYKLIEGHLGMIAYEEGVELLSKVYKEVESLRLGERMLPVIDKELRLSQVKFEVGDTLYKYKLLSPWIALNQDNYVKYRSGEFDLNRQMQNNLLSNFKDLGIRVTEKIMCHGEFTPVKVVLKDTQLIAFQGEFVSNVIIPEYMGVGKRKSIGYGRISRL